MSIARMGIVSHLNTLLNEVDASSLPRMLMGASDPDVTALGTILLGLKAPTDRREICSELMQFNWSSIAPADLEDGELRSLVSMLARMFPQKPEVAAATLAPAVVARQPDLDASLDRRFDDPVLQADLVPKLVQWLGQQSQDTIKALAKYDFFDQLLLPKCKDFREEIVREQFTFLSKRWGILYLGEVAAHATRAEATDWRSLSVPLLRRICQELELPLGAPGWTPPYWNAGFNALLDLPLTEQTVSKIMYRCPGASKGRTYLGHLVPTLAEKLDVNRFQQEALRHALRHLGRQGHVGMVRPRSWTAPTSS